MTDKALGLLASTFCGALIGLALAYVAFASVSAEHADEASLAAFGILGSLLFGVAGLAAGIAVASCRALFGSSFLASAVVGALGCGTVLVLIGSMFGINSANAVGILVVFGISCLPGLAFQASCRIRQHYSGRN